MSSHLLESSNPPLARSPGQRVRELEIELLAERRISEIKDQLIEAIKAKAQGEVQAAKAEGELKAKDLSHSLQRRTVALAQLSGKLTMRGFLGESDNLNVGCLCSCYDGLMFASSRIYFCMS